MGGEYVDVHNDEKTFRPDRASEETGSEEEMGRRMCQGTQLSNTQTGRSLTVVGGAGCRGVTLAGHRHLAWVRAPEVWPAAYVTSCSSQYTSFG